MSSAQPRTSLGTEPLPSRDLSFTIFGARGYIGSRLCRYIESCGHEVSALDRFEVSTNAGTDLGHVIFAAGVTADFRTRTFDTVNAHVTAVGNILQQARYDSFLYLSSTRVYQGSRETGEDAELRLSPGDPLQLYNASKMAGEALCLALPDDRIRVARLSNVYGADDPSPNFLADITRAAIIEGHVALRASPESYKDFVSIEDVLSMLPQVVVKGRHRIYNIASGRNTRYGDIMEALVRKTGCTISLEPDGEVVSFPRISIDRLAEEFGIVPVNLADDISNFIDAIESRLE